MSGSVLFEEITREIVDTKGFEEHDSFSYPLHSHPQTELFMVTKGTVTLLSGPSLVLGEGDAALISPLVVHGYESSGPAAFCSLVFEDAVFQDVESMPSFSSGSFLYRFHVREAFPDGEAERALEKIVQYSREGPPSLLLPYCRILLTLVLRRARSAPERDKITATDDRSLISHLVRDGKNFSSAILPYIRMHYREKLTLNDLARHINSNPFSVSHSLNAQFRATLSELVNRYRIQEACILLTRTDNSILRVSELVGYESVCTFNRNFRKLVGLTPREYRRNQQNGA